jgi:hypothetical protein
MKLIAGARWLLSLVSRRASRPLGSDPADMGTAFGLDAITTTFEPDAPGESPRRDDAARPSRFELRLHRRSTL